MTKEELTEKIENEKTKTPDHVYHREEVNESLLLLKSSEDKHGFSYRVVANGVTRFYTDVAETAVNFFFYMEKKLLETHTMIK